MNDYLDIEYKNGIPSLIRDEDVEEYLDLDEGEQIRIQIHLHQYGKYKNIYETLDVTKDLSIFTSVEDAFECLFPFQHQKSTANNYLTVDYDQFSTDCLFYVDLLDGSYYVTN